MKGYYVSACIDSTYILQVYNTQYYTNTNTHYELWLLYIEIYNKLFDLKILIEHHSVFQLLVALTINYSTIFRLLVLNARNNCVILINLRRKRKRAWRSIHFSMNFECVYKDGSQFGMIFRFSRRYYYNCFKSSDIFNVAHTLRIDMRSSGLELIPTVLCTFVFVCRHS